MEYKNETIATASFTDRFGIEHEAKLVDRTIIYKDGSEAPLFSVEHEWEPADGDDDVFGHRSGIDSVEFESIEKAMDKLSGIVSRR